MRHCRDGRHAFGQPAPSQQHGAPKGWRRSCSPPRGSASWQDAEIALSASCGPSRPSALRPPVSALERWPIRLDVGRYNSQLTPQGDFFGSTMLKVLLTLPPELDSPDRIVAT